MRLATLPYRDLIQVADEEGGLKQQFVPLDQLSQDPGGSALAEERLFDDDSDAAADRKQMQRTADGPHLVLLRGTQFLGSFARIRRASASPSTAASFRKHHCTEAICGEG